MIMAKNMKKAYLVTIGTGVAMFPSYAGLPRTQAN